MGRTISYRAKCMVLKQFMRDWTLEFSRLCDYVNIIKSTNIGSSCLINWATTKLLPASTSYQPSQQTQPSQPIPPAPIPSSQTSNPPSMCNDTSAVRRSIQNQSTGIGRGRGRGLGFKRRRPATGFGVYTDIRSGRTIINISFPVYLLRE